MFPVGSHCQTFSESGGWLYPTYRWISGSSSISHVPAGTHRVSMAPRISHGLTPVWFLASVLHCSGTFLSNFKRVLIALKLPSTDILLRAHFKPLPVDMSIKVELHGDSLPDRRNVTDVFRPQLLTFDNTFIEDNTIEHKDVVITWKGISFAQATEIVFWEAAFRRALENLIEETLIEAFLKYDDEART